MRIPISAFLTACALCLGALPSLSAAAWVHFNPLDSTKVPKLFSQTGFYTGTSITAKNKIVTSEAAPFDVNAPLWSDNAAKKRWVLLKPATGKIKFDPANDYYGYPDGTVFIKLFQHDTIPGDTASRIYWETRLLVVKKMPDTSFLTDPPVIGTRDSLVSFSYKWNRTGTEASLVSKSGLDTTLTLTVSGQKKIRKWSFPSEGECNGCHRQSRDGLQGRAVLGFFTPQLNRPSLANPSVNQISDLFTRNILEWANPAVPTSAQLDAMAKWARISDTAKSLDLRARSYIAANCSGCHGARGLATQSTGQAVEINFDFFKLTGSALLPEMEYRNMGVGSFGLEPITTGTGETLEPALIVPGHPELSVLLHRQKRRNQALPTGLPGDTAFFPTKQQMPGLGVFEVDTMAVRYLTEWIRTMPPVVVGIVRTNHSAFPPILKGNLLTLRPGMSGTVLLSGLDGRKHDLKRLNNTSFMIPERLPAGIYMLRVGEQVFKLIR